jgi:hypothetical protein
MAAAHRYNSLLPAPHADAAPAEGAALLELVLREVG